MKEETTTVAVKNLPSIKDLFKEAWEVFKKSILQLFLWNVLSIIVSCVFTFLMLIVIFGPALFTILSKYSPNNPQWYMGALQSFNPWLFGVGIIILMIGSIIISSIFQIGMILVVDGYSKQVSFKAIIKKSFALILPVFLASLLVFFLAFGSFFVFILPAIVVGFFLMFVSYEVIVGSNRGIAALKRSTVLVSSHFGEILIRELAIIGLYILLAVFIPNIILRIEPTTGIIIAFYSFFTNMLLGWYMFVYAFILYKQVSSSVPSDRKGSIVWMWVVAILGWIIGIFVFIGTVYAVSTLVSSGKFQQMLNSSKSSSSSSSIEKQIASPADDLIKSGNTKINTALQISQKKTLTTQDRDQFAALITGAITDYKAATDKDPKNVFGWYNLGYTYSILNSIDPSGGAYAIEAYKKAIEVDPQYLNSYMDLGGIYYRQKDYPNAIATFQEAIKVDPKSANAHFNLGMSYKMYGSNTSAKKEIQKSLDLLPANDPTRYKAEAELQGL